MDNTPVKPRVVPATAPEHTGTPSEPVAKVGDKMDSDLFMTYSLDHDVPFVADYYGIGNMLAYKDLSYKQEVDTIDNYLVDEVKSKRLDNNTNAIKTRLKQLEKIAGIDSLAPTSIRVKQLAAYAEYMKKLSDLGHAVTL